MDLAPGYREFAAPAPLAPLIACLWVRACDSDDEVAIMPDGASDVIWRQGHGTTIVGPDTTARAYPRAAGELLLGVRFRPGAGGGGIGVPLDALRDRQVDAREIDRAFDLDGGLPPGMVFRRFLAAAADRRPDPLVLAAADLAGPAFDAGYADQAHLTRESRRLADLSPVGVIAARRAA